MPGRVGGRHKKILISAFVPRTGHLAEALAQVRSLESGKWLERLDETIEKAAREAARQNGDGRGGGMGVDVRPSAQKRKKD